MGAPLPLGTRRVVTRLLMLIAAGRARRSPSGRQPQALLACCRPESCRRDATAGDYILRFEEGSPERVTVEPRAR